EFPAWARVRAPAAIILWHPCILSAHAVAEPLCRLESMPMRIASRTPVLALLAALAVFATAAHGQLAFLVINEVYSDTPTAPPGGQNDDREFIELYDGGIGNQSLVGYTLVFYNGGSGTGCQTGNTSYFAMDLTGSTDVNGYYLVGTPVVTPTPNQTWPVVT